MKDLGGASLARWRVALGLFSPQHSSHTAKPRLPNTKKTTRGVNPTMDANAKHFETELLARAEEAARRTAQLSPEANVVTATAL